MLGRTGEADLLLQHLSTEWPESWYTWEAMGTWYRETGNDEGAWRAFLKATALHPGNPSIITSLVTMDLVPNRYSELAVALENHLALEPLNLGFRGCLANCFLHTGALDKAYDQARRIVLFAPFSVVPAELVSSMNALISKLESI
jgi:predicted Zn-dependent protease